MKGGNGMKPTHWLLVICFLLVYCIPAMSLSVNPSGSIDAMNSVKEFMGNPNIKIEPFRYEHTAHAEYTVMFDKTTEYWVNSDTNRVERYSAYGELDDCKNVRLTLADAQILAESFIEKHNKEAALQDFSLVMNEFVDKGDVTSYNFLWRKYIGKIECPSLIFVSVNPATGAIIHYISIDRPVTVPLENQITQQEAESISLKEFPGIEEATIDSKLKVGYDEKGSQRLMWECLVSGAPKDFILQGGIVHIDAQRGEIIRIDVPM